MPIELQATFDGHKRLLGLVEPTFKRVRAVINGETIADTPNAYLLYDSLYAPRYLFPKSDVKTDFLSENGETTHNRMYSTITHYDVAVGGKTVNGAAVNFSDARGDQDAIDDYIGFEWDAVDEWYIEDELTFGHARHPYHRLDLRDSSRRVQVAVNGVTIADTTKAIFLFETGLPARYYIPVEDINIDYLHSVDTETVCPYKGYAAYHNIVVGDVTVEDGAWYYPTTERGMEAIQDKIAFYNEHNDITITVTDS